MFGFMKKHSEKDKEEKERKKRDRKEKKLEKKQKDGAPMSAEEMQRLDQIQRELLYQRAGESRKGSQNQTGNGSSDSISSGTSSQPSPRDDETWAVPYNPSKGPSQKTRPPPKPAPKPKGGGILKGKSKYGPDIPGHGVRGNLDDTNTLEENTIQNELLSEQMAANLTGSAAQQQQQPTKSPARSGSLASGNKSGQSRTSAPPPPASEPPEPPTSPAEKTYGDVTLQLPSVAPPRVAKARQIQLRRQPAGDFGISLRRGHVLERELSDNSEVKRTVIFAEPGPKNTQTGLLPGDRLVEVNGQNVESKTREDIIELIKASGDDVTVKVQPIPELSELSCRSGVDGSEADDDDSTARSGTLKRSGSFRYKNKEAKSEDDLAKEQAWLSAEKVWLVHKGGFAGARVQRSETEAQTEALAEKCRVKLDFGGQVLEVDEDDVEKANPPQFDRVEDLANLRYLNESSVLHTLRQRYGSNLVHTYSGKTLVVVNPMHPLSIYSEKVIHMFRGCKPEDMPPHVYATAQSAYRAMLNSRTDQALVLLGRSGAGKTTSAKHMLNYLTVVAGGTHRVLTTERLGAIYTLLDSFGHSRTIMNTSATRFTSLWSLDFDHAGLIASASIQVLMLERTRVTSRPEGEPTFHVFYQLLAGVDSAMRKELQLENLGEPNCFMTPLQRGKDPIQQEDRSRATQAWAKVLHSMVVLGLSDVEQRALLGNLAAIYHLGVAGVTKGQNNRYHFGRTASAQRAAAVLGVTIDELTRSIFHAAPPGASSGGGSMRSPYRSPSSHEKSSEQVVGREALEGFVSGLYNETFYALVSLINRTHGASFEDLCSNYAQERLQLLFHSQTFTSQQDLYSQENVDFDYEPVTTSPAAMVNFIDNPGHQMAGDSAEADNRGLLWLLEDEAMVGSNESVFLEKVWQTHGRTAEKRDKLLCRSQTGGSFLLNHFQGTSPVLYNTKGWLKAARENPVSRAVSALLQESNKPETVTLFSTSRGPSASMAAAAMGVEGTSSLRRASSLRRSYTAGAAGLKRKSLCLQAKFQVDSLIETLRRTKLHFVHCVLPQHNAGLCDLKEDILLNVPLVRAQLRGAQNLEAIRIHRQGYPEHQLFHDFRMRFEMLLGSEARPSAVVVDEKEAVEKILSNLDVETSSYRLGLSQKGGYYGN